MLLIKTAYLFRKKADLFWELINKVVSVWQALKVMMIIDYVHTDIIRKAWPWPQGDQARLQTAPVQKAPAAAHKCLRLHLAEPESHMNNHNHQTRAFCGKMQGNNGRLWKWWICLSHAEQRTKNQHSKPFDGSLFLQSTCDSTCISSFISVVG